MALFVVTRKATTVPLVIEAMSVIAENGVLVFSTVKGDSLVTLAAEDVRRVEKINPSAPPWHSPLKPDSSVPLHTGVSGCGHTLAPSVAVCGSVIGCPQSVYE